MGGIPTESFYVGPEDAPPCPAHYVKLSIQGHVPGICEDHRGWAFEPYFTIREGESCLALSVDAAIAARHRGHITLGTEVGTGTVFDRCSPAPQERPAETAGRRSAGGSERPLDRCCGGQPCCSRPQGRAPQPYTVERLRCALVGAVANRDGPGNGG